MYRFPSATREPPKHLLCTSLQTAGNRGNLARGASNQHVFQTSIARPPVVAPTGTTTLSRNWTTPRSTATAETPQFPARPNQGTCHCPITGASTTIPRTVPVISPRSAAQCALCAPRSACSWNVHHSVEELNRRHQEIDELLELPLHDHRDVTNQSTQYRHPGPSSSPVPSSAQASTS